MALDQFGNEVLDDTPVAVPVRLLRPPSKFEELRAMMGAISRQAAMSGQETEEEANDFDVGDDYDPRSIHEIDEDLRILAEGPPQRGTSFTPESPANRAPMGSGAASQAVPAGAPGGSGPVSVSAEPTQGKP